MRYRQEYDAEVTAYVTSSISDQFIISWHDMINLNMIPASFPIMPEESKICQLTSQPDKSDAQVKQKNIRYERSSTDRRESKGHADSAVKVMQNLLLKSETFDSFRDSMLKYRKLPRDRGSRPAQWHNGKRQLTSTNSRLHQHEGERERRVEETNHRHDLTRRSRPLREHANRTYFRILHPVNKKFHHTGTITKQHDDRSSYRVNFQGRQFLPDRKHYTRRPVHGQESGRKTSARNAYDKSKATPRRSHKLINKTVTFYSDS